MQHPRAEACPPSTPRARAMERCGYIFGEPEDWCFLCKRDGVFGYGCACCSYVNDRFYHAKMHYERVHVNGGKGYERKRKYSTWTGCDAIQGGAFDVCKLLYSSGRVFLCRTCGYVSPRLNDAQRHLETAHPPRAAPVWEPVPAMTSPWCRAGEDPATKKKRRVVAKPALPALEKACAALPVFDQPHACVGAASLEKACAASFDGDGDSLHAGDPDSSSAWPWAWEEGFEGLPLFCQDETSGIYSMSSSPISAEHMFCQDETSGIYSMSSSPISAEHGAPAAKHVFRQDETSGIYSMSSSPISAEHGAPPAKHVFRQDETSGIYSMSSSPIPAERVAPAATLLTIHEMSSALPHYNPPPPPPKPPGDRRRARDRSSALRFLRSHSKCVKLPGGGVAYKMDCGVSVSTGASGLGLTVGVGSETERPKPRQLRSGAGSGSGPRLVDGIPNRDTNWRAYMLGRSIIGGGVQGVSLTGGWGAWSRTVTMEATPMGLRGTFR